MSNAMFGLFHRATGVRVTFQLDWIDDEQDYASFLSSVDAALNMTLANGYVLEQSATMPAASKEAASNGAEVHRIVGMVFGKGMDKKLKMIMPRLYLYVEHRPYAAYTIFHEKIATLPAAIQKLAAPLVAQPMLGELQAPEKAQAIATGLYREVDFQINVEPDRDHDGTPRKNSGGYTIYRYVSSVGVDAPVTQQESPQQAQPANGYNPTTNGTAQRAATNGAAKRDDKPVANGKYAPTMGKGTRAALNSLGTYLYSDGWDAKRHELAAWCGNQRQPAVHLESSNDLTEAEADLLITGMENAIRRDCAAMFKDMKLGPQAQADMIADCNDRKVRDLNLLSNVALTHAANAIAAMYQQWINQQMTEPEPTDLTQDIPF